MSSDEKPLLRKWRMTMRAIADPQLTGADLRVLPAVLDRMGESLEAWPGYGRIASDTGLTRRTATRSIERLVHLGYLKKQPRGTCISNLYRIGDLSTPATIDTCVDSDSQVDSASDMAVTPLSVHVTPEFDSLNPTIEPDQLNLSNKPPLAVARFDEFWAEYPRKEAKKPARAKWKSNKLDQHADRIIADVRKRCADPGQWKGKDAQFIPLPSTYLHQRRFDDEWSPAEPGGQLRREDLTPEEIEKRNQDELARAESRWRNA